jgi:hypothetical protein
MRLSRSWSLLPLAGACLLAAAAQADVIDYSATGSVTSIDNAASLLPSSLSAAAVNDTFTLNFAVDTSIPGNPVAPGDTQYVSSVVSAYFSLNGGPANAVDLGGGSSVEIFNNAGGVSGFLLQGGTDTSDPAYTGTATSLNLATLAFGTSPLYPDTSLNNGPLSALLANLDSSIDLNFVSFVGGQPQASSDFYVTSLSVKQTSPMSAPEIDPSSMVGGLTLLMGGMLVLRGRRKVSAI